MKPDNGIEKLYAAMLEQKKKDELVLDIYRKVFLGHGGERREDYPEEYVPEMLEDCYERVTDCLVPRSYPEEFGNDFGEFFRTVWDDVYKEKVLDMFDEYLGTGEF